MALNGSFTGTTTNKYIIPKITWSATQNKDENYSTVTATLTYSRTNSGYSTYGSWKGSITINGTRFNGNQYKITISHNSNTFAMSATAKVPHNADGSKTVSISATGSMSETSLESTNISASVSLDRIPRAAIITAAPNFNDEQNPTISYDNSAGSVVKTLQACISFDGSNPDIPYRDISKTGTSYTFNLTEAERKILRAGTKGSNSRTIKFYIKTVIGDNTFYNSVAKTLTIINGKPTLNPVVYDTNASTIALTGSRDILVTGYSQAYYSIGAAAAKEATIASQSITHGLTTRTAASGTISAVFDGTFTAKATDSRGNTAEKQVVLNYVKYVPLTLNFDVEKPTTDGILNFTVKGRYFNGSFGAVNNMCSVFYRYKEKDGTYSNWIGAFVILDGNSYKYAGTISGLDYRKTYTVQARVFDKLVELTSNEISVSGTPVFDWGENDFNFNVPVTMTVEDQQIPLMGLVNAFSKPYACSTTFTPAANYSNVEGNVTIFGNNANCYIRATRTAASGTGNIANEIIATVTVNHGGRIIDFYNCSFGNGINGSLASFYMTNMQYPSDTEIRFDIGLAAAGTELTSISTGFCFPVSLDITKYV